MSPGLRADRSRLQQLWANTLPRALRSQLQATINEQAGGIVEAQKELAPVESGDLRDSLRYVEGPYVPDHPNVRGVAASGAGEAGVPQATIIAGDARAFYAAWVEFGTRFAPAHPYFFPVWRTYKARAMSAIGKTMKAVLRDMSAS